MSRHKQSKAARHREHMGMETYERGPVKHHRMHGHHHHPHDERHHRKDEHGRHHHRSHVHRHEHDTERHYHRRHHDHHEEHRDRHHALMLPPDMAEAHNGHETQMYHHGRGYYGPGYGHIANMPPYADLGLYPKSRKYLKTDDYPDTIQEIDRDNDFNYGQMEHHRSDSMY